MIVIYGSTGFVGSHIVSYLCSTGSAFMCSKTRVWQYKEIYEELSTYKATTVINAAGYPTPTNIDYYEESIDNKSNLFLTNTAGNIMLADICHKLNIHYVTIMSGCIFDSTTTKRLTIFSDDDKPNFYGSLYSRNRIMTEDLLSAYNNICVVRIRMPVSSFMNKKSLINKLINYKKVTNIPNSVTVLDDCVPKIYEIANSKKTGIVNLVNSGTVTNAYICYLYKIMLNSKHYFEIADISEIEQEDKPKRSNCIIQPSEFLGNMPDAKESIYNIFKKFKRQKDIYC